VLARLDLQRVKDEAPCREALVQLSIEELYGPASQGRAEMIAAIYARKSSGALHDVLTTGKGRATEEP
jgi:hypothetical protein